MSASFFQTLSRRAAVPVLVLVTGLAGCRWMGPGAAPEPAFGPPTHVQLRQLPALSWESLPNVHVPRMIVIPRIPEGPEVNGDFAAKCWNGAAVFDGFTVVNQVVERAALAVQPGLRPWEYGAALQMPPGERGRLRPAEDTKVLACWDKVALHLAFQCADNQITANVQQPDGPVWIDDSVELFLAPPGAGSQVFHIAITARGTKFDERFQEGEVPADKGASAQPVGRKWECKMSFITGRGKGMWWAQMAIPFRSLDVKYPVRGEMWQANLARWCFPATRHASIEFNDISTWSPAESSPGETASLGRIYFEQGPAAVIERLMPGRPCAGVNTAQIALKELSGKGVRGRVVLSSQTLSGDVIESTQQPVALPPNATEKVALCYKLTPEVSKCYLVATLLAGEPEKLVDVTEMAVKAEDRGLTLDLRQDQFIAGHHPIHAVVNVNVGDVTASRYGLEFEVLRGQEVLASAKIEGLASERIEAVVENQRLEAGQYTLRPRLTKDGKVESETSRDIQVLNSPF